MYDKVAPPEEYPAPIPHNGDDGIEYFDKDVLEEIPPPYG